MSSGKKHRSKESEPDSDHGPHSNKAKGAEATQDDIQLATYLTEMKSDLGHRSHVLGCLIRGCHFEIWLADASAIVRSELIDYLANPKPFIHIMMGLMSCGVSDLGFSDRFIPPPTDGAFRLPTSLEGWSYRASPTCTVLIEDTVEVRWGLVGRGPCVFQVKHKPHAASSILKTSWPFAVRERGGELLRRARDLGGDNVTVVWESFTGDRLSDGPRKKLGTRQSLWKRYSEEKTEAQFQKYMEELDRVLEILIEEPLYPLHSVGCSHTYMRA